MTITANSALAPLHSCDSRYGQSRHKIIIIIVIIIIVIIIIILSRATDRPLLPGTFPREPNGMPTAQTQVSDNAAIRIMCVYVL